MAHVASWKNNEVQELTSILTTRKVIGIVNVAGIPGPQIQNMRGNIRSKAQIRAAKNSLIKIALDEAEKQVPGISKLKSEVNGQAAIIAADVNPFHLYKEIKATRTHAPAKGGEIAQNDIIVKAGDTPFKPGPIVGELQKAGIPAAIQEGKVVIKTDKVIVPAGKKIPTDVAQMLTRLEIYPLEIGLTLNAVYELGNIYKPDVLDIDMDKFMGKLATASSNAFAVAMKTAWTTKATINQLIMKAHRDAYYLALEQNILTKDTIPPLLSKAHRTMLTLAKKTQDAALDEDLKKNLT
ncbi:MAG: 50S ribosomal protein L10 [Candidatus Thermoplasmatota archaeon]